MQRHGFHYSFTQIPSQPRTEEAVPSEHPGQNIDLVTASSPGSYHHELNTPRQGDNPSIYYSHSGTQWPVQSSSALDVVSEPAYQQDGNIQDSQSSNLTGYVHAQSMSNWWAVNDPSFAHVRLLHGDPMRYATELQPSAFPPPNHVATEWIHPNAQPMPGSAPQRITQSFETLAERTGHYDHHHFQTTAPLNQNVQYNSLPRSFPIVNDTVAEPGARVHEGISSGTISHAGHTVSPSFHLRGMPQHHIASSSGNLTTGEGVIPQEKCKRDSFRWTAETTVPLQQLSEQILLEARRPDAPFHNGQRTSRRYITYFYLRSLWD
ncbi:uncharacterized protein STEHIDRAFT_112865 [Stereum hirsutum FP-91666 SS1]|uniref:uncharacterized protein n=1 Tax=Stereum hirsutum (strain FP-91666) TaxID=721885 RepID=UPI000444A571|nr:uncharacterized protein STEHIDRAFT_112865 [Stereum hirsutum FP-91666 SS1]EIM84506.1 hypothetical protein STEHIDRAFT_112865 [Stereum hirsutum FP-91666 SS1]